jgi:hypothetical protein
LIVAGIGHTLWFTCPTVLSGIVRAVLETVDNRLNDVKIAPLPRRNRSHLRLKTVLSQPTGMNPQTKQQVVDTYFMEHRAKLVDIAAYLDRIDRGQGDALSDFRDEAFRRAVEILLDGQTQRARRILELLSDHSTELPQSADGMKGAMGAVSLTDGGAA